MFDQKKYISNYLKDNYKDIKIRVRNDDDYVMSLLDKIDNKNKYIIELIKKDFLLGSKPNFFVEEISIEFALSETMKDLVRKAEAADTLGDYGLYMNYAMAIDAEAKKETANHTISEGQWNVLIERYRL